MSHLTIRQRLLLLLGFILLLFVGLRVEAYIRARTVANALVVSMTTSCCRSGR